VFIGGILTFMIRLILALLGGTLGAGVRHSINFYLLGLGSFSLPTVTITVNSIGSLCAGIALAFCDMAALSQNTKLFIIAGLLGGLTTWSAFIIEIFNLLRNGATTSAVIILVLANVVSLLALIFGYVTASMLISLIK